LAHFRPYVIFKPAPDEDKYEQSDLFIFLDPPPLSLTALLAVCCLWMRWRQQPHNTPPPSINYTEHPYVRNAFDTNISQYTINQTTGVLAPNTQVQGRERT